MKRIAILAAFLFLAWLLITLPSREAPIWLRVGFFVLGMAGAGEIWRLWETYK